MDTAKKYLVAGFALSMVLGSAANAANKVEEDSAYQWGRWAVLSPAAGGGASYVAPLVPDAANNARPGEAGEFQPRVVSSPDVRPPVPVQPPVIPPGPNDPRDRLPPRRNDPRDRLPPRPSES